MSLFKLGEMFSYQDANDIKRLWADNTPPADAGEGEVWLDTSNAPNQLKRYTGTDWDIIGEMTATDILSLLKTVDGSGSGLDADQLDGQHGSFYQDASNLSAGTLSKNRLPAEVVRTDQDTEVPVHTQWQDGSQVRFGNEADLRLHHNGTDSCIDNYNGDLLIRQLDHGSNTYLQAEDASGSAKNLLTLDPDAPKIQSEGAIVSQMYSQTLAENEIFDTGIPRHSVGFFILRNSTSPVNANGATFSIGENLLLNNGVSKMLGVSFYGNTKDDSSINVYCESSGNVNVQNVSGGPVGLIMGFMGGYLGA